MLVLSTLQIYEENMKRNIIPETERTIKNVLNDQINTILEKENLGKGPKYTEEKIIILENRLSKNIERMKKDRPMRFYLETKRCTRNKSTYAVHRFNREEICYEEDTDNREDHCRNCTRTGYTQANTTDIKKGFYEINTNTLELRELKRMVTTYKRINKRNDTTIEELIADSTHILFQVARTTMLWQEMGRLLHEEKDLDNRIDVPVINWSKDPQKKIELLDRFSESIQEHDKKEISGLKIFERCEKRLSEQKKNSQDPSSIIGKQKILPPSTTKICEQIEKLEKEYLKDIIEKSKNEKNTILRLYYRIEADNLLSCYEKRSIGIQADESDCIEEMKKRRIKKMEERFNVSYPKKD